jgi:hypothetical protein
LVIIKKVKVYYNMRDYVIAAAKVPRKLKDPMDELGIKPGPVIRKAPRAFAVSEDGTSKVCAYHNVEVWRKPRGLVMCPHGHTMYSDINGGLNTMARGLKALGVEAELPRRIRVLSSLATPSRTIPIKTTTLR